MIVYAGGKREEILPEPNPAYGSLHFSHPDVLNKRGELGSTINFLLPEPPEGDAKFLFLAEGVECRENTYSSNPQTPDCDNCMVNVSFLPGPVLKVQFVGLAWTDANGIFHPAPTLDHAAVLANRFRAIFPIGLLEWDYAATTISAPDPLYTAVRFLEIFERSKLYHALLSGIDQIGGNGVSDLYGLSRGSASAAFVHPYPNPYAYTEHERRKRRYRQKASHEIGHTLGRPHSLSAASTSCPLSTDWNDLFGFFCHVGTCAEHEVSISPEVFPNYWKPDPSREYPPAIATLGPMEVGIDKMMFGFDFDIMELMDPRNVAELMTYCDELDEIYDGWEVNGSWVSSYTYSKLHESIVDRFGTLSTSRIQSSGDMSHESTRLLAIRGTAGPSPSNIVLDPIYSVSASLPPSENPGPYELRLKNIAGDVVYQKAFGVQITQGATDEPFMPKFLLFAPFTSAVNRIEIWLGDILVVTRSASASPPTISLQSPAPPPVVGTAPFALSWNAADSDGDSLSFIVQFSRDNGTTWRTIVTDVTVQSFLVRPEFLRETSAGRFRVIASDGFWSTETTSDYSITVAGKAPVVRIVQPAANAVMVGNVSIHLSASAFDAEDGGLSSSNIVWFSDRDGMLGTGANLVTSATRWSEGRHVISAVVTDSSGMTNIATVPMTISRVVQPVLRLQQLNPTSPYFLRMIGQPNSAHVLEVSEDLASWTGVQTNMLPTGWRDFSITNVVSDAKLFYRLRATQ